MNDKSMKLYSIVEIDSMKGIRTPHDADLKDIGKKKILTFRNLKKTEIEQIASKIGARIDKLGKDEEWAITKSYFPEVNIHILYQFYGNEFGDEEEDELQFLYSGERVFWISGEDLVHFSEITIDILELMVTSSKFPQTFSGTHSNLVEQALIERFIPFTKINKSEFKNIASFIGGKLINDNNIEYFPFKELKISITITPQELKPTIEGKFIEIIPVYDAERILIMTINHCLRYIKTILKDCQICNAMFSGLYKKSYPEQFEK